MSKSEPLNNYCDATFPLDLQWGESTNSRVRLLGAVSGKVIGYSYFLQSDGTRSFSQALHWDGDGRYADGAYPQMDLVPPYGMVAARIAEMEADRDAIIADLRANRDAPKRWRNADEARVETLNKYIAQLSGVPHEPAPDQATVDMPEF